MKLADLEPKAVAVETITFLIEEAALRIIAAAGSWRRPSATRLAGRSELSGTVQALVRFAQGNDNRTGTKRVLEWHETLSRLPLQHWPTSLLVTLDAARARLAMRAPEGDAVTASELATLAGVTIDYVNDLGRAGSLTRMRHGIYSASSAKRWLASRRAS